MAFSGIVKAIKDLVSGTPSDSDYFIFGSSDAKKISFSDLKKNVNLVSQSSIVYVSGIDAYTSEVKRIGNICIVSMCFGITGLTGFNDKQVATVGYYSDQYVNMPLFYQGDGRCVDCFIKQGDNKIIVNARDNNMSGAGVLRGALMFPIRQ